MTPEEFELCRDLMTQDELRQYEERERRRVRRNFWRTYALLVTAFVLAVTFAILTGCSVWPETVIGANV